MLTRTVPARGSDEEPAEAVEDSAAGFSGERRFARRRSGMFLLRGWFQKRELQDGQTFGTVPLRGVHSFPHRVQERRGAAGMGGASRMARPSLSVPRHLEVWHRGHMDGFATRGVQT